MKRIIVIEFSKAVVTCCSYGPGRVIERGNAESAVDRLFARLLCVDGTYLLRT